MYMWIINGVEFNNTRSAAEYIDKNCNKSLHNEMPEESLRLDDIESRLDGMDLGDVEQFHGVEIVCTEN